MTFSPPVGAPVEAGVRWRESPHHSPRGSARIRWVALHADASPAETATTSWVCNPKSEVSYHSLIHRDGSLTRYVRDERAAWACGKSRWQDVEWLNRWTLNLAFSNRHDGKEPLTRAQIDRAQRILDAWRSRYPVEAVLTHAMIAPGRKSDPDRIPNFRLSDYA